MNYELFVIASQVPDDTQFIIHNFVIHNSFRGF